MAGTKINFTHQQGKVLSEVIIIKPSTFQDERGFLYTDYLSDYFEQHFQLNFNHSKTTVSKKNVLRGIHGDSKTWKLINCVFGDIVQVVVDCRKESKSFGMWEKFELSHKNPQFIMVPPGFGNGFLVKSDQSVYNYKLAYDGQYSDYDEQFTFRWNEATFKIDWGHVTNEELILSKRDR